MHDGVVSGYIRKSSALINPEIYAYFTIFQMQYKVPHLLKNTSIPDRYFTNLLTEKMDFIHACAIKLSSVV
jgi:hypothetical protein